MTQQNIQLCSAARIHGLCIIYSLQTFLDHPIEQYKMRHYEITMINDREGAHFKPCACDQVLSHGIVSIYITVITADAHNSLRLLDYGIHFFFTAAPEIAP